jgi:EmrB/QacA subfamily drug resistance transporter
MAESQARNPRRWKILGVLILAVFGVSLDNTVLTVALPTLARDLGASVSQLQWMVDAYILVYAGLLLVAGALSDRFGRRLMLVIGLGLFGAGSAAAPFVSGPEQLIFLRGFMGLGAALATPSTLSIVADVFGDDERPKAIAVWSTVGALGMVVGPIVGGILLDNWAWPVVFVVNVPLVLVGIAATLLVVPESKAPGRIPLDPLGAVISVVGLVALVYAIIEQPSLGWSDPAIVGSFGLAAAMGVLFVAWERRVEHPMLDVSLFRNRRFSAASLSVTLSFFALNGAMFFLTLYLQQVKGYSALETGVRFIAIAIGVALASSLAAPLTIRYGARIATALGLGVVAIGMALFSTLGVESGDLAIMGVLLVASVGLGLAMTPATDAIMGALPREKFGVGSAMNDVTREVGGALGVAILGSVFSAGYANRMAPAVATLPAGVAEVARESLVGAAAAAEQLAGTAGTVLLDAARSAFVGAMGATSMIGVGFAILGAIVALAFLPDRAVASGQETAVEPAGAVLDHQVASSEAM